MKMTFISQRFSKHNTTAVAFFTVFNPCHRAVLTLLMAICLLGVPSVFASDDMVNPCTFTTEDLDCDPGGGGSPAEIKIKSIKLNGKRKDSRVVNINQDLQLTARLKYVKRAKAKITTNFSDCPAKEKFKRVKPEPTITWQVTVDGTPTAGGSYNQVYTGTGLEPLVPAPPQEGVYSLTAEFLADAPGDNCFTGLPLTEQKIFSLQVFDGPALIDITAVISHDGGLKRSPTPIASGSYLCRGQGVSIDLTANFALPLAQYNLTADDVTWTVNKPDAGDLSGGAGGSGETVTWTQAPGYTSDSVDNIVFTATAPDMDPMGFTLTIFHIDATAAVMTVGETQTITIPDHMIQPAGADKTKIMTALAAVPTSVGSSSGPAFLWTREYTADHNNAPGMALLPVEATQTGASAARIIKTATFQLTGSDLELVLEAGSTAGEVNLVWESEKPPEPTPDPSPGIDSPARLFHRQHVTVLEEEAEVDVESVHLTGDPSDTGPKWLCKDNGTAVSLTAKPVAPGDFSGTPLPHWTVATTAGTYPAPQPSPNSGVDNVSLTLNEPGSYEVTAAASNSTSATYAIHVLDVDLDIDSDNNSGLGLNESLAEDAIEDVSGNPLQPGKVIGVNDGDTDHDGVPGYADGFDRNGTVPWVKDDLSTGQKFTKMILKLPEPIDLATAQIQFIYDAADPFFISQPSSGNSYTWGIPTTGNLRIWTKNADVARDAQYVGTGDYIHTTTPFNANLLSFNAARKTELYLEGIRPSAAPGDLSIEVQIDPDGAGPAGFLCGDTIRVTVTQVEILDAAQAATDHVQVALWDDAFQTNGNLYNSAAPASNFIDRDSERFYVRITDHAANQNSGSVETVTAQIGTVDNAHSADDDLTEIQLEETGANTGVFLSKSQMLMSPDLPVAHNPDDDHPAHSAVSGTVNDDQQHDRTHRASVAGAVDVVYNETAGQSCFVCDRSDNDNKDERRKLQLQFHILMEPYKDNGFTDSGGTTSGASNGQFDYEDLNNNGRHDNGERSEKFMDISTGKVYFRRGHQATAGSRGGVFSEAAIQAQLERAQISWAQACVDIVQIGGITYHDAPTDTNGDDILADGGFHYEDDANILLPAHQTMILNNLSLLHVFFVAEITGHPSGYAIGGVTYVPRWHTGEHTAIVIGPNLDIRFRTLAHEVGHALTNLYDTPFINRYFFPQQAAATLDDNIKYYRRLTPAIKDDARTVRPENDHTHVGNRLLIDY